MYFILTIALLFNLTMLSNSYGTTFINKTDEIIEITYNKFYIFNNTFDYETHRAVLKPAEEFDVEIVKGVMRTKVSDLKISKHVASSPYKERQISLYSGFSSNQERLKTNPKVMDLLSRIPVVNSIRILNNPSIQNIIDMETKRDVKIHSVLAKNISDESREFVKKRYNTGYHALRSKNGNGWTQEEINIEKHGDEEATVYEIHGRFTKDNGKIIIK